MNFTEKTRAESDHVSQYMTVCGNVFYERNKCIATCQQNKRKLDAILLELRKQLQQIMSGGRTNA